jgi:hypothetical protein
MPTNTKESGLETLIVNWLVERNGFEQGERRSKVLIKSVPNFAVMKSHIEGAQKT